MVSCLHCGSEPWQAAGAPTHASATPMLGWERGHANKLPQGKQGREFFPPPYLCVLVTPRKPAAVPSPCRSDLLPAA